MMFQGLKKIQSSKDSGSDRYRYFEFCCSLKLRKIIFIVIGSLNKEIPVDSYKFPRTRCEFLDQAWLQATSPPTPSLELTPTLSLTQGEGGMYM